MAAELIDGTKVGARVREEVRRAVEGMPVKPGLATILVGDDPASAIYVGSKRRACVELGIRDLHQHVSADITQESLADLIVGLGADPDVTGILLQLPLPAHLDAQPLIELIPADKDVDGLSILSGGRLARHVPGLYPCTPLGVLELLDSYHVQLWVLTWSSSAARIWSAGRWRRCFCSATRPSPAATRAHATWSVSAAMPMC